MKNFKNQQGNKIKFSEISLRVVTITLLLFSFFILNYKSIAQTVDWRSITYIEHEYGTTTAVDQRHSDYDWWYDHCNANPNEYIGAGVGKYRSALRTPGSTTEHVYKEDASGGYAAGCSHHVSTLFTGGYDYNNWENPLTGNLGMTFNQVGKITDNLNGATTKNYLRTYNYGGEYYRVKRLNSGEFLAVGQCLATKSGMNSPTIGLPLFYNPNGSNSDYFKYSEIYTGSVPAPTTDEWLNFPHWDILKFDGSNGNPIFNSIYGMNNFTQSGTFNILGYNGVSSKQHAYLGYGESYDFTQEPGISGNIAVVGYCINDFDKKQGALIKINTNGVVLEKKFFPQGASAGAVIRGIEYGMVNTTPCYIVAISYVEMGQWKVQVIAQPTTLSLAPIWSVGPFIVPSNPNYPSTNIHSTIWSVTISGDKIYVPLINNCNNVDYSGDNFGDLNLVKIDLATGAEEYNERLSDIHAFDIKARTTLLSGGDIGVVSSKVNQTWYNKYKSGNTVPCLQTINGSGQTPCSYMLPQGCSNFGVQTNWWNSDTYVARVNPNTGAKIWETTFDANSPAGCGDFPENQYTGGGDPKHQECMYGISESVDGGIVVSGNMSANYDDNYMAKVSDCGVNGNFTVLNYTEPAAAGIILWDGSYPWSNLSTIRVKDEIRIAAGAHVEASNMTIEFGPYARLIIEPGASLKLFGCTLTSSSTCNKMWQGVRVLGVYGDKDHDHNGFLELADNNGNHTLIKNAIKGIANWDDKAMNSPGGKIFASNTVFADNKTGVEFVDDGNDDSSIPQCPAGCRNLFLDCEFKMNSANLLAPYQNIGAQIGISMNGVQDVDIQMYLNGGNRFTGYNNTTARMGKAIESIDSKFSISNAIFTNCNYGIKCETSIGSVESNHFFNNNTFNNCYYGIHMRNGLNDFITNNQFNPGANPYSHLKGAVLANKYGVYLDGTGKFKISGNTFKNLEYAAVIVNSGSAGGQVIPEPTTQTKNLFDNCWRGVYSIGDNSKLNIRCNTFTSNTVASGFHAHWFISGKMKDQGLPQLNQFLGTPAGNTFQHVVGNDIIAVQNTANFKYYYNGGANANPSLSGLVSKQNVNGGLQCNPPDLMVLAGNSPEVAEQLINAETDDEVKELFVNQLSSWYQDNEREQDRVNLLIAQNEEYANQELIPIYFSEGDYQEAMDRLQEYNNTGDPDNDDYYQVMSMQLDWAVRNLSAFNMDASQEQLLREISEHGTRASASARVIINQVFGDNTEVPYENDTAMRKGLIEEPKEDYYSNATMSVAPNPANDKTLLTYSLPDGIMTAEIVIVDITGRLVQKYIVKAEEHELYIDTRNMANQVYICKLTENGAVIYKQKLIIVH